MSHRNLTLSLSLSHSLSLSLTHTHTHTHTYTHPLSLYLSLSPSLSLSDSLSLTFSLSLSHTYRSLTFSLSHTHPLIFKVHTEFNKWKMTKYRRTRGKASNAIWRSRGPNWKVRESDQQRTSHDFWPRSRLVLVCFRSLHFLFDESYFIERTHHMTSGPCFLIFLCVFLVC